MELDKVADMELEMVADIEVDKVADKKELTLTSTSIWKSNLVGELVNWAQTFSTKSLPDLCVFYCFASLFCSHSVLHSSKMVFLNWIFYHISYIAVVTFCSGSFANS